MSSFREVCLQHCDEGSGLFTSAAAWDELVIDLDNRGLLTAPSRDAMAEVISQGRFASRTTAAVTVKDVMACIAADGTADSVDRSSADVQNDVAALWRFAAYVEARFSADSPQRAGLRRGMGDVAEEYRAALAGMLQLATLQIARADAARRAPLLRPHGLVAAPQYDPFSFQRQHARAIQRRSANVFAIGKAVAVDHRLYPRPHPRAILDASTSGGSVIGPGVDVDPKRATGPDLWLSHRTDRSAGDCAAAGVPYELEALRVPLLGALDPAGTAAATFTALDGAAACVDACGQGGFGLAMLGGASPGAVLPIPAPSSLIQRPRAHASSLAGVLTEQDALGQLILSQYFPDPCGLHDVLGGSTLTTADERCSILAGASAILGPTVLLLREYVQGAVPLAQLRAVCGPLAESRPLFRCIATELLHALADVAGQCCYDVARIGHSDAGAARCVTASVQGG